MAIYHLSVKIISRGKNQSAVASAAYRSGQKLTNLIDNKTFDYSRKSDVAFSKIFLPERAPKKFSDRQTLWNDIESSERNCNAQLAREIEFALPVELSFQEQKQLACSFAETFAQNGMCADLAFHNKPNNPHCHLMLSMRSLDSDGNWLPKNRVQYKLDSNGNKIPVLDKNGNQKKEKNGKRIFEKIITPQNDWNNKEKIFEWRKLYQDLVNSALLKAGTKEHVDCRSYSIQGIKKLPTIHLGQAATAMEQRGIITQRGNFNRQIISTNTLNQQLQDYIDLTKKIPPANDPATTFLWLSRSIKNIKKDKEKLEEQLRYEIDLLKNFALRDSIELKAVNDAKSSVISNDENYWKYHNLVSNLNMEVNQLKNNEPDKTVFNFLESKRHKLWKLTLQQKNIELQDAHRNEDYFALARESSRKSIDIAESNFRTKYNSTSVTSIKTSELQQQINELEQDLQYLNLILKNLSAAVTSIPKINTAIKKFNLKISDIFTDNQPKTNLEKFDTSPHFIRILRTTEQNITNQNFLTALTQNLQENSTVQLIAYSNPNVFKIPTDWELLSELDKDELKQKKIWRSI